MKFNELTSHFMIESANTLNQSMTQIHDILDKKGIRYVFIGGAILGKYGFYRMTEDVDLLIHKDDKEKFKKLSPGWFKLNDTARKGKFHKTKTLIDILYSGDNVGDSSILMPEPGEVSVLKDNIPILSLQKLIEFKLTSAVYAKNRLQDLGDIQRLIIINKLSKDYVDHLDDEKLKAKYVEIWDDTQVE